MRCSQMGGGVLFFREEAMKTRETEKTQTVRENIFRNRNAGSVLRKEKQGFSSLEFAALVED